MVPNAPPAGELEAWLWLAHTPGLSRAAARALLAAFGSARAAVDAPAAAVRALVPARAAAVLEPGRAEARARLQDITRWLEGGAGRSVITLGDAHYPVALLQTEDPPLILYLEGCAQVLSTRCLAIVGSRNATPAGLQHAREFAGALAGAGWVVVSGLARGIDAAAHEGALAGAGHTVAVVGTGPDQVYPAAHKALARRIAARGALLSEFPPGTPPLSANFPQRNRIIAGICQGVLVVEAALQSGSLITARLAAEAGREVFALPGSIDSPQSRGCHALLKQGAKLVETLADILDEFPSPAGPAAARTGPAERATDAGGPLGEDAVLRELGYEPTSLDALCARLGWPVAEITARLLEHELQGHVARLPGGLYQRIRRA